MLYGCFLFVLQLFCFSLLAVSLCYWVISSNDVSWCFSLYPLCIYYGCVLFRCHSIYFFWPLSSSSYVLSLCFYHHLCACVCAHARVHVCVGVCVHTLLPIIRPFVIILDLPGNLGHFRHQKILNIFPQRFSLHN